MVELIDLTAQIREGMANHPAHGKSPVFLTGTRMTHEETEDTWRGKGVEDMSVMNGFVLLAEHNGTHVDAPIHIHPDGEGIDEVPLEECYGPGVWLDLSDVGPRAAIGPDDLEAAAESAGVEVRAGDTVLLHTDWDRHLPDDEETYLSDHPGLSEAGAQWLHDGDVSLVGIDCGNVAVAPGVPPAGRARETHAGRREPPRDRPDPGPPFHIQRDAVADRGRDGESRPSGRDSRRRLKHRAR